MMIPFQETPPDLIDPSSIDFGDIGGVPAWVPLAAQLIPWIVGLVVDPDAENRQRVLVSAVLSGVIAAASAMTAEAGATFGDVVVAFLAALLSAQVGYGLAKGFTNGAINELSTRRQPVLPPGYQPPYAYNPPRQRHEPEPMPLRYESSTYASRPVIRYAEPRREPTEEIPVVRRRERHPYDAVTTAQWASEESRTTFQYPNDEPEPPPNEGGRRYV